MQPKKISPETKRFPSPFNKSLLQIYKRDELITLLNKFSVIYKNFIKILKNNISKNKEDISIIDNNANYSHNIVNNIINHNYSFAQLKSLNESLSKIKEINNNNKISLLNEEQNILLFLEQSDKLFKMILKKQKLNLQKRIINNSISHSPNNTYNNTVIPLNKFIKQNDINPNLLKDLYNTTKRNKSAGNSDNSKKKNKIVRIQNTSTNLNNINNIFFSYKDLDNNKTNKQIKKKSNLTPPVYKAQSTFNMEINNNDIIKAHNYNSCINRISPTKLISDYNTLFKKYELIKSHDLINIKNIQNLNKEIANYKKLIDLFSKNKLNEEINIKNKKINLLTQEIETLKKQLENKANKNTMQHRKTNKKMMLENISDNLEGLSTDPNNNTSNSFNFTDNVKNFRMNLIQKEKQIKMLKNEKLKLEKYIKEQNEFINKGKILQKENNIFKAKLNNSITEYNDKINELERKIHILNEQLKKEINKNEELNVLFQKQKIKFEYEISLINDKRAELSKLLANKNNEIIKLQKEMVVKNKEFEEYKLSTKKNSDINEYLGKLKYYENIIHEKNKIELDLNNKINIMKNDNEKIIQQNEKRKNEIIELNKTIIQYKDELSKKNDEINKIQIINNNKININNMQKINIAKDNELNKLKNENKELKNLCNNLNEEIKKLKDENEGLKEFVFKIKEKEEKFLDKFQNQNEKISLLQKENEIYKQYFSEKNMVMPPQDLNKKQIKNHEGDKNINILSELNDAKKEIIILKKKNEQLFNELESKKFENQYRDNFSEGKIISNYEEEFDLKKMAKGAKDKNRSQDINIDYPGAQQVKEKYRELDFYYNSLEELVKKLLLNCTCTNKNKVYISELCKIVGFEDDVTYKIVNNKSKKGINIYGQN